MPIGSRETTTSKTSAVVHEPSIVPADGRALTEQAVLPSVGGRDDGKQP